MKIITIDFVYIKTDDIWLKVWYLFKIPFFQKVINPKDYVYYSIDAYDCGTIITHKIDPVRNKIEHVEETIGEKCGKS